jgi:hypothetical protein
VFREMPGNPGQMDYLASQGPQAAEVQQDPPEFKETPAVPVKQDPPVQLDRLVLLEARARLAQQA